MIPLNASLLPSRPPSEVPPGDLFVEDLRLMEQVAAGNRSAQATLVARLSGRVRRVCKALLRNPSDGEDTAQLALLEILRSADNYRGASPIERWADRVVARVAGRVARKRTQLRERLDPDADFEQVAIVATEPSATEAMARSVSEYLDLLPEQLRIVLVLRHSFDYSMEEIGNLLDVTANAAKKRLNRATQAMRRMIRRDRVVGLHLGRGQP